MTHPQVAVALGAADCEAWRPGLLHQPVNALSSLAFAVAGVWVAVRSGAGAGRADRVGGAVYAGALIGNGVGSFLYHGPGWPGSAFVHDAAIPAALLFIAAEDVALLRGWSSRRRLRGYALGLGTACLTLAVVPAVAVPTAAVPTAAATATALPAVAVTVTALTGTLAAAAEMAVARRGRSGRDGRRDRRDRRDRGDRGDRPRAALVPRTFVPRTLAPAALAFGLAGLAGAAVLAGRTGSPLCRPDSLLQGHALWHVLGAGALLGWDRVRRARRAAAMSSAETLRSPVPWGGPASR